MIETRRPKLLVIDDDQVWLDQVPMLFEDDCDVDTYPTIDQGLEAVTRHFYDIVLLDLNFEGDTRSGLQVFRKIHALDRETDVIVISGETDHNKLIEVFNAGVSRFLPKMSDASEVRQIVFDTIKEREIRLQTIANASTATGIELIGNSPQMQKLRSDISRAVSSGTRDILLQGETGTGKELVARSIAYQADPSRRFIAVHCGAVNENLIESEFFGHLKGAFTGADREKVGVFQAAGGGFVFLDEIGEMPLSQQAKILRVLQERVVQKVGCFEETKVNFRCVSATHVDLELAVKEGRFREDLYYRIAKDVIHVPTLRERIEDIPELIHFFLSSYPPKKRASFTKSAMGLMQSYSWPGNVRQLKGVVESLAARCEGGAIREKDIYTVVPETASIHNTPARNLIGAYSASIIMNERQRFEKAIIRANGDRTAAAKLLDISRATFFRRAKELGLVNARRSKPKNEMNL
jgi:DNA-binding NtrC family response regulator